MNYEQAKRKAVAAIRRIVVAAKDLEAAEKIMLRNQDDGAANQSASDRSKSTKGGPHGE
jgi:hypothetical protein